MAKQRTPYDSEVSKKKKIHGMMGKMPFSLTPEIRISCSTVAEHLKRREINGKPAKMMKAREEN